MGLIPKIKIGSFLGGLVKNVGGSIPVVGGIVKTGAEILEGSRSVQAKVTSGGGVDVKTASSSDSTLAGAISNLAKAARENQQQQAKNSILPLILIGGVLFFAMKGK